MALVVGKLFYVIFHLLVQFFYINVGWSELPWFSLIPTTTSFFKYILLHLVKFRIVTYFLSTFGVLNK